MPDLSQEEQTCLPTSTANLIVWFGTHGYPNLIAKGDSKEDNYIHTVHGIITATDARYDFGTRMEAISYGIQKYIHDAGYTCDIEYRGLDWSKVRRDPLVVEDVNGEKYKPYVKTPSTFSQEWLQENNDPNKGFILLLAYCHFSRGANTFTPAFNAGHAVTLVNAEPNMILIHDPAHYNDEPGRKILTPEVLTGGVFMLPGYDAPTSGLIVLDGSLLEAPHGANVLLTGAVCITMHPNGSGDTPAAPIPSAPGQAIIASNNGGSGNPSSSPASPAGPGSADSSWAMWLFDMFFKK